MQMYIYLHIYVNVDVTHDHKLHIPTMPSLPTLQSIEFITQNVCIYIYMHMYA